MAEVTELGKARLQDYVEIVEEKEMDSIKALADKLKGESVTHVNATAYGGGVAEILCKMVPLMSDVGLSARWKVIKGGEDFFEVTKKFHNALQGMELELSDEMKDIYTRYNRMNSELLSLDTDYVVIHDPQPAAMIQFYPKRPGKWIWRCHIDLSTPNMAFWNLLAPYVEQHDAAIFTMQRYVEPGLRVPKIAIIPPSIDPMSDKNRPLSEGQVLRILDKYDVDPDRPIVTQVSRFDPWKDPLGVIDVYRMVRKEIPGVQLLMVGAMATDDPEGTLYYEKTIRHAGEDYDIHFLTNLVGVGHIEVNAFQTASDVVLQKSTREGFALTVTEALWKGVPVIGGNVGGIPLQVVDGVNGFLVESVKEAATKTVYLLEHAEEAKKMGQRGREHVRKNFLMTRHLKDYLKLFVELAEHSRS